MTLNTFKNMITLILYYIINVININWNNFNDNTKLYPLWVKSRDAQYIGNILVISIAQVSLIVSSMFISYQPEF